MTILGQIAQFTAPWQTVYSDSVAVSTSVTVVHLVSLLFAGGLAIAADRATLRVAVRQPAELERELRELRAVHRPVLLALGVLVASGVLLAAADVETYAASPTFWVKLSFVLLLLANGALLARTEAALRDTLSAGEPSPLRISALWQRLRRGALTSVALWTATLVAGAVLVNA